MTPVRLELAALRSRVKHSTTEPLSHCAPHILNYKNIKQHKSASFFTRFIKVQPRISFKGIAQTMKLCECKCIKAVIPRILYYIQSANYNHQATVNAEIFSRILYSRIALKDIFTKFKIATCA